MRPKGRSPKRSVYLRRSPFLIAYWSDKNLVFENYLTRKRITATPELAAILHFFSEWKTIEEVFRHFAGYSPKSLLEAVSHLLRETLLDGSQQKNPPDEKKTATLRNWKAWNPAASFFHFTTKDTYADEVTPEEIAYVEQLAKLHPVPKPLKAYPGARVIRLKRGG